ncbi:MAG TPA: hypothetical protein VII30_04820 [Gemmatimonadaceae bacterium]
MADAPARILAHCILAATEPHDVWTCLRTARRLTGFDVAGYLDGSLFTEHVDSMGEPTDLETLKTLAAQYLGEPQ